MNRIADLTLTGLLYALLLFAPLLYGSVQGWPLVTVELLALVAVSIWVAKMIAEGELALVRTPLGVPCLLFVGALVLQLVLGNSGLRNWALSPAEAQLPSIFFSGSLGPASTRHALWLFLTYAAVYFLVVNHFRERMQLDRLVRFLLVLGSLLAFYGLLDYLSGSQGIFGWRKPSYTGRVTGTFVNPDHFAAWLAMLIPLALGFLLSTKLLRRQRRRRSSSTTTLSLRDYWITDEEADIAVKKFAPHRFGHQVWQELLLLFAITIMTVAVVFTLSRAGVVSLILSVLVLIGILLVRQAARRSHLLIVASVLLTLSYAAWIGLDPMLERFGLAVTGLQTRLVQYWASLPMLAIAPILGTGLGTYGDLFPRFQLIELAPATIYFTHAHNDHLQFWIETGLVGGLILLFALWSIVRDLLGAHLLGVGRCLHASAATGTDDVYRRDPYNVGIAIGALGGVAAVFFHSFLDFSLRIPANGILLATLLGIATVALHNRFFRNITQGLVTVWRYPIAGRSRQVAAGVVVAGFAVAVFFIVTPQWAETRFQSALASIESQNTAPPVTSSLIQRLESERKSLELLGGVISISPGHVAARRQRASKLEALASQAWNKAIGADGQILKSQEERAKAALALLDQAEEEYRRALNAAPYDAVLHERFAWLLGTRAIIQAQSEGKAEAAAETRRLALTHFSRAVTLNPANPGRHRLLALFVFSQWRLLPPASPLRATALSAVRKAVELNPELLPELLDRALTVTVDREDLQALVPATSIDHLHLAILLDKKGLRLQADENYQKALKLASPGEKPIYHRFYASSLVRAKRFPEALSELESTVGLDPGNPDIYLSMAEVLSAMGENSGALVNFHTALMLAKQSGNGAAVVSKAAAPDADGLPPHRRLFVKLVQSELGQPDSAKPVSRVYRFNFALARYYTKRGQFSVAIPLWEALLQENPADARARFHLALALDGAGAWQAAFTAYKQAIELDRRNIEYKAQMAQRLFENEKFFHAIELWQAILAQEPGDLKTRLRLAQAYVRVGELRDASREYERVLQVLPGHREAREALAALRGRLLGS